MQIIVPYFNYTASPVRRANLDKVIAQIIDYPHLVCCFSDDIPDCNTLVFDKGAMVWQKERLLNLGTRSVDSGKVMFLDADCIFEEPDWYDRVVHSLEQYDVVQCFNSFRYTFDDRVYHTQGAIARLSVYGKYNGSATGGAWAFNAPVPSLYEHAIVGGGDTIFCDWLLGKHSPYFLSPAHLEHYREWCNTATPPRNMGYVPLHADMLPCGTYASRKFAQRHQLLKDFSPLDDTFIKEGELIQMPNKKLELSILDYIMRRDK